MSAMTNYLETAMLNTMRGITAIAPARVYIALLLSDPTESGTNGTEVNYAGYQRQAVVFSAPATDSTTVRMVNASEITFATPPGPSGTITFAAIMDAQTGGNMLAYKELTNHIVLTGATSPRFAAGEIALMMSGGNMDPSFKVKVLNYVRGTTVNGFAPYLALYNGDPNMGGTEIGGTGYARIPLIFDVPAEQVSGQMQTANTNAAQSQQAATNWGTWAFGVIMDAETSGNRIWSKQNPSSYSMANNARAYLQPGNVLLALN